MKTAIIVLNYNSEQETEDYVNKIKEYNSIDKIIVVDNMSTTIGAYEKLKKLECEKVDVILSEKNGGYSYGNNYGIRYLEQLDEKYENIIISNSDIDVENKTILKMIEVLNSNEKIAVAAPRMFYGENIPARRGAWKYRTSKLDMIHATRLMEVLFYKVLRSGEYSDEDYKNDLLKVDAISGSFFAIKYDVLKKINYFDENVFLFYEEDILAKKLKDLGLETYCINSEKFIHYESRTINKTINYFKKMKQLYNSKMYYQEKYNNIGFFSKIIFKILYVWRFVELLVEVPMRKILKK